MSKKKLSRMWHLWDIKFIPLFFLIYIFQPQDNQVESIRLKTNDYELIASQEGGYTLVVIQEHHQTHMAAQNSDQDEEVTVS